jgi:hypothetical protein
MARFLFTMMPANGLGLLSLSCVNLPLGLGGTSHAIPRPAAADGF